VRAPAEDAIRPISSEAMPGRYIRPRTLTVLGTYKCTAMCENCCFDSNPRIERRLSLDDILRFIDEGAALPSVKLVVFSGGECFLLGDDLVQAVEAATAKGLRTRCVTNGYWAQSLEHGRRRLQALKSAGLCELNISTGDFHQRYVAAATVVNAACLGVESELDYTLITVELQKDRDVTAAGLLENPTLRALAMNSETTRFKMIESPWMPMSAYDSITQHPDRMVNRTNVHQRHGCKSVFSTIVVTPSAQIGFCCGLSRERIPELNAKWDGASLAPLLVKGGADFMKIWLFVDGPERILAWAAAKRPEIEWEDRYSHHCHACLRLFDDPVVRRTILDHYKERVDDVLMRYSVLLRQQELLEGAVYG
jgi:hypothetical protein